MIVDNIQLSEQGSFLWKYDTIIGKNKDFIKENCTFNTNNENISLANGAVLTKNTLKDVFKKLSVVGFTSTTFPGIPTKASISTSAPSNSLWNTKFTIDGENNFSPLSTIQYFRESASTSDNNAILDFKVNILLESLKEKKWPFYPDVNKYIYEQDEENPIIKKQLINNNATLKQCVYYLNYMNYALQQPTIPSLNQYRLRINYPFIKYELQLQGIFEIDDSLFQSITIEIYKDNNEIPLYTKDFSIIDFNSYINNNKFIYNFESDKNIFIEECSYRVVLKLTNLLQETFYVGCVILPCYKNTKKSDIIFDKDKKILKCKSQLSPFVQLKTKITQSSTGFNVGNNENIEINNSYNFIDFSKITKQYNNYKLPVLNPYGYEDNEILLKTIKCYNDKPIISLSYISKLPPLPNNKNCYLIYANLKNNANGSVNTKRYGGIQPVGGSYPSLTLIIPRSYFQTSHKKFIFSKNQTKLYERGPNTGNYYDGYLTDWFSINELKQVTAFNNNYDKSINNINNITNLTNISNSNNIFKSKNISDQEKYCIAMGEQLSSFCKAIEASDIDISDSSNNIINYMTSGNVTLNMNKIQNSDIYIANYIFNGGRYFIPNGIYILPTDSQYICRNYINGIGTGYNTIEGNFYKIIDGKPYSGDENENYRSFNINTLITQCFGGLTINNKAYYIAKNMASSAPYIIPTPESQKPDLSNFYNTKSRIAFEYEISDDCDYIALWFFTLDINYIDDNNYKQKIKELIESIRIEPAEDQTVSNAMEIMTPTQQEKAEYQYIYSTTLNDLPDNITELEVTGITNVGEIVIKTFDDPKASSVTNTPIPGLAASDFTFLAINNIDAGYIDISLKAVGNTKINTIKECTFEIRKNKKNNNIDYYITTIKGTDLFDSNNTIKTCYFKDFSCAIGEYDYKLIPKKNNETYAALKTVTITSDFEHLVLIDEDDYFVVKYNPKVSNFKTNLSMNKFDTLGNKYPIIRQNSVINYKQFSLGGLISREANGAEEDSLYRTATWASNSDIVNITNANIIEAERQYKNKILNWLNNGKYKILKSPTEGNFIVQLMNVSLTPMEQLGRTLHSFTCEAYETMDYNISNINEYLNLKEKYLSIL